MDWRLFLPGAWDDRSTTNPDAIATITARRKRSAIPETEHHRPKWEMTIEMIDELTEWGRTPPTAVADPGYGDTTAFRLVALFDRFGAPSVRIRCERAALGGSY
ncbi:transposase [Rhodococcus sp. JVH1]|uniref:transposase n=1 Tax=Rhodococcus sp. JVH1 TaxID=745408 RepID=UPI000272088A|nr:transposase [Rhodococcus sp. JVH1]EJI98316.1 transposase, IS4 domain protein [Rhodococcus sp. JVH1]